MLRPDTLPPIPLPYIGHLPDIDRTHELPLQIPREVFGPTQVLPQDAVREAARQSAEGGQVAEAAPDTQDKFSDHQMSGVYQEMVLTNRPPLRSSAEVERLWGIRAAEVADIVLPYFRVPMDYTNPDREAAMAEANHATDIRNGEHELVALQQERSGRHAEAAYIVTSRAVLFRVQRMPRLQRAAFMRLSPEVKHLRNGDQLAIGRGKTETGAPRWLPAGVPESEPYLEGYPLRRRAVRDDEGAFTVSHEGVLSYTSRGYNPARFTGYAFPEETAYEAARETYDNAAFDGTTRQVDAARQIRDAHAETLPARRRRLPSDVSLNIALGRLIAADEAETQAADLPQRPVYSGDTDADKSGIPVQRTSPENHSSDHP